MARTPTDIDTPQHIITDKDMPNLPAMKEAVDAVAIGNEAIMEKFDVIKAIGRLESARFFGNISEKLMAEIALSVRDGKKYKGLVIPVDGKAEIISTFDEFCEKALGKTGRHVRDLMNNYNMLGPELYEKAEQLGFRHADYKALKALPADDRQLIAQAMEDESFDKALDLMQEMAARHFREKEAAQKLIADKEQSLVAKDRVISEKTAELNKKAEKLALLETSKRQEIAELTMPGAAQLSWLQTYTREITAKIEATLRSEIVKLYGVFDDQPPKHIELAAAQSLGLIITAAYGVAHDLAISPVTEPETAADDPAKANAEAFMKWEEDGADIESLMDEETLANYRRVQALTQRTEG
jgi:hypothetical protein